MHSKLDSIIGEGPDKKSYLGDDDFVEVFHRNIRISYHLKNDCIDLPKLIGTIRRINEKLVKHLHWTIRLIEVEIYDSREQWIERHTRINEKDLPSWIQGDSGRVIRIYMKEKSDTLEKLQLMITHECVHKVLSEETGDGLPAWFDEGLAIYLSQNLSAHYQLLLKEAVAKDALLPISILTKPFSRLERRIQKLAYAQSSSMVGYLIENYGWKMVRRLLKSIGRGDSLDAVLTSIGLTGYLLEKEWKQNIRSIV